MKTFPVTLQTRRMLADLQTPVGIYLKVRDQYPQSALLESSDYHGGENSFSFIAFDPIAHFIVSDFRIEMAFPDGSIEARNVSAENKVPECMSEFIAAFHTEEEINPLGINGLFGYCNFEAAQYFEDIQLHNRQPQGSEIPEVYYTFYRYIIGINHYKNELIIVENLCEGKGSHMDEILALLENRNFASYNFKSVGQEHSDITNERYMEMVSEGKKHCYRGDVFQIVLSRRFWQSFMGDDFKVYRTLRSINPSPYLFYFDFGSFRIFGSSPETHLMLRKGMAFIDPIAGTFRRTGDDGKDKQLAEELLHDPKENAEHVMLVDLARNDLARNTKNVKLEIFREVQYYSHVLHLVSRVSGQIEAGTNPFRLFADTFPAGTLSGAPKVRAMQLIDEIESHGRGYYGGCIGYIGLNGDFTQAITIRAFLSKNNTLIYQAGAGIVSKSDEATELEEVNTKLAALKCAIDAANELIN
ncbi:MAG: anthranilate synthase component I family protein [Rikenellaceae bacterium]